MYTENDHEKSLSSATIKQGGSFNAVSSESSLDSFIMGLPAADELPTFTGKSSDASDKREQQMQQRPFKHEVKLPTFTRPSYTHIANTSPHSIPDFLYQLTKMLADENSDVIEWNNAGRIEVHNPHRLETEVLHKYFRHSKFASLQRQLNYFGFRKLAGKGKMAPCSYVNEAAKGELGSLIYIKRKGSVSGPDPVEKPIGGRRKASSAVNAARANGRLTRGNTVVVDPSLPPSSVSLTENHQQALARSAAGRGIRHGWSLSSNFVADSNYMIETEPSASSAASSSLSDDSTTDQPLSQLERNYANCVNEVFDSSSSESDLTSLEGTGSRPTYGFLSRNSSLIDLAMIPEVDEEGEAWNVTAGGSGMSFVDFPNVQRSNDGNPINGSNETDDSLHF